MEKYLNQGIKPLIEQFPVLGDILNKYDIGCTDCTGGSCLLKDVVAIHNVSPQIGSRFNVRDRKSNLS